MQKDLEQYAQFKRKLGLYSMDLSFLSEFYCTITDKNIEKRMSIVRATRCNEEIEEQLVKTNTDIAEYLRYNKIYTVHIVRLKEKTQKISISDSEIACIMITSISITSIVCCAKQNAKLKLLSIKRLVFIPFHHSFQKHFQMNVNHFFVHFPE